jgi:hypothetical protein
MAFPKEWRFDVTVTSAANSTREEGVPLVTLRALADYWRDEYDWRRFEQVLEAVPQYCTSIDGLAFHFLHMPSAQPDAMPLVIPDLLHANSRIPEEQAATLFPELGAEGLGRNQPHTRRRIYLHEWSDCFGG